MCVSAQWLEPGLNSRAALDRCVVGLTFKRYFTAKANRGCETQLPIKLKFLRCDTRPGEIQHGLLIDCEIIRATVESIITVANLFRGNEDAQK